MLHFSGFTKMAHTKMASTKSRYGIGGQTQKRDFVDANRDFVDAKKRDFVDAIFVISWTPKTAPKPLRLNRLRGPYRSIYRSRYRSRYIGV